MASSIVLIGLIIARFFAVLLCLARSLSLSSPWIFLPFLLTTLPAPTLLEALFVCVACGVPHTNRHVNGWFITFECLVYLRSEHHGQTECRSAVRMLALRLTAERGGEKGTTTMGGSGLVYGLRLDVVV